MLDKQKLFIRADANEKIAMGHVMRCLSIAEAFRARGGEAEFLLADGYVCDLLEQRGFPFRVLESDWKDMEGEMEQLRNILQQEMKISDGKPKILVDSYQATENYLRLLGEHARVIYIDDLNRFSVPAAMVVNYASFAGLESRSLYKDSEGKKTYIVQEWGLEGRSLYKDSEVLCMGWQYTPLRLVFADSRHVFCQEVKNILVTTGGSDPYEMSVRLADRLLGNESFKNVRIHVVAGKFCQCTDTLQQMQLREERLCLYRNISNMEELMCQCDFAVSAGGTTVFELFACGVPVIAFGFAENQMESLHLLAEQGALCYMGDAREDVNGTADKIVQQAEAFCRNASLRKEYEKRGHSVTDGRGAFRIADAIQNLGD